MCLLFQEFVNVKIMITFDSVRFLSRVALVIGITFLPKYSLFHIKIFNIHRLNLLFNKLLFFWILLCKLVKTWEHWTYNLRLGQLVVTFFKSMLFLPLMINTDIVVILMGFTIFIIILDCLDIWRQRPKVIRRSWFDSVSWEVFWLESNIFSLNDPLFAFRIVQL